MSSTLYSCKNSLSKDIGDGLAGTTTSAGTATTLVDASLMAKANDFITDNSWVFLTSEPAGSAAIYDERKVQSLDNTTGTLTCLAFAAAPGTGITYDLNRLFSPTQQNEALVYAAKSGYPWIHKPILDISLTVTANAPTKDISTIGFAQNQPTQVEYCELPSVTYPIWTIIRDWRVTTAGILYLPSSMPASTLRLTGMGYLDFLLTGAVSTAWTATIALDNPQTQILTAEAAIYLYNQMAGSYTTGGREYATERLAWWVNERNKRRLQFGMPVPAPRTHWGVG